MGDFFAMSRKWLRSKKEGRLGHELRLCFRRDGFPLQREGKPMSNKTSFSLFLGRQWFRLVKVKVGTESMGGSDGWAETAKALKSSRLPWPSG